MALSTKAIKSRIQSVGNTKKITKAMEMVAASKMRKAVERSLGTRAYARLALELLVHVSQDNVIKHPLLRRAEGGGELLVIFSSNKGLCGAYNMNIYKRLTAYGKTNSKENISAICIGKYAEKYAKKFKFPVIGSFIEIPDSPLYEDISGLSKMISDEFISENFSRVKLVYTNYISAISNEVIVRQLLPIDERMVTEMIEQAGGDEQAETVEPSDLSLYLFESSEEEVLDKVLPILTEVQIFQALLESFASEHSARMMAMRNASDNADEMVQELTLTYNKARQAAITQEITEIATGAQALN